MIRRRGTPEEESSDDEEEDVFSSLSKRSKGNAITAAQQKLLEQPQDGEPQVPSSVPLTPAITSSMKRHHGMMSNRRKAQMDAVLQELEREKMSAAFSRTAGRGSGPEKRGSYVDPNDEQVTTNLFVGNLDPDLTETAITRYFSQFGDLHSVKIMWPRTAEDRARNRVSGFFCYKQRRDAKNAMDACNDSDPFHVGRRLKVRWGKVVLQDGSVDSNKRDRVEEHPSSQTSRQRATSEDISQEKKRPRRHRQMDGSLELEPQDMEEFHTLTKRKLCASRQAICNAMAFCFEHSPASTQISQLLKELMLDGKCSVETRIARLYLLSDVLFNSQQPGVKNAFRYRDAIEKMSHEVFYSLGQHRGMSRMSKHKMQTAVRTILSAWTNWSVFDHSFLDELETRFKGHEIIKIVPIKVEQVEEQRDVIKEEPKDEEEETPVAVASGDWTEVNEEEEVARKKVEQALLGDQALTGRDHLTRAADSHFDDEDIDGEALEDGDLDQEGLRRLKQIHEVSDDDSTEIRHQYEAARKELHVDGVARTECVEHLDHTTG